MLEFSSVRFAVTYSMTCFLMVSKISGEMVEGELDCGTEPFGDCFPLLVDVRFVKSVDFRIGAMNTIENNCCAGISKWYFSTQFKGDDCHAIFYKKIFFFFFNKLIA